MLQTTPWVSLVGEAVSVLTSNHRALVDSSLVARRQADRSGLALADSQGNPLVAIEVRLVPYLGTPTCLSSSAMHARLLLLLRPLSPAPAAAADSQLWAEAVPRRSSLEISDGMDSSMGLGSSLDARQL